MSLRKFCLRRVAGIAAVGKEPVVADFEGKISVGFSSYSRGGILIDDA